MLAEEIADYWDANGPAGKVRYTKTSTVYLEVLQFGVRFGPRNEAYHV